MPSIERVTYYVDIRETTVAMQITDELPSL